MSTGRRLWAYAAVLPKFLWVIALVLVLRGACELTGVMLIKPLTNLVKQEHASLAVAQPLILKMVLVGLGLALTEFATMYLCDYVAQYGIKSLRGDLFSHVQRLSLGFFEDASTGQLISKATNDLNVLQTRLNYELTNLVKCPVVIVALLVKMLWDSWALTLVAMLIIGAMVPVLNFTSRRMKRHTLSLQERMGDMTARLQESISAIRVVQCFGAGDHEIARFELANVDTRRAMMRTVRVRAMLRPLIHLIGLFGVLAVLVVGGYMLLELKTVEVGDIVTVVLSLQVISSHFKELGKARMALAESIAAADRVFGVIDARPDIVDSPEAVELARVDGRLELDHVHFSYKTGAEVLDDVTLTIEPGQVVALVGASGAGKSSLANLIPRLYDVSAGRLRIDGHDVRDVTLASLRRHIGIVPQQTVLFRGTVAENIAYGRPEATRDEIRAAAVAANADQFIVELPFGYDTECGERGAKLSGGQAQRVAIARAILRDPRILILDEATSSLDSASEALVQEALDRLMRDRTSVVIAHRLSTVQNADQIVVMEHGRIVETGSPGELLAREDSHYRRFHQLQMGEAAA